MPGLSILLMSGSTGHAACGRLPLDALALAVLSYEHIDPIAEFGGTRPIELSECQAGLLPGLLVSRDSRSRWLIRPSE